MSGWGGPQVERSADSGLVIKDNMTLGSICIVQGFSGERQNLGNTSV